MKYWIAGLLALTPSLALADGLDKSDTAWILVATALVLFMTLPGLSLFYGGLVRNKNVLSVLMQCFAIACAVSLVWLIAGYSLAFSDGGAANAWIGGLQHAFFAGIDRDSLAGSLPQSLHGLFQMTFAIITPALIVGAFAERMRFGAMLAFSVLWVLGVYVPVCHWVWGGGWLAQLGLYDFAGGTVVHITAGVAALVAAVVLGRRKDWPGQAMKPHNMTMTVMGAGMLWVGWFGFNGGSALAADGNAAMAMLVTHISAAAGSLAWLTLEAKKFGKPSALGIATGMVAGLGTITPASGFVGPGGALIIGLAAGVICFYMVLVVKQRWRIDDSLDVFPVHGVGGILGTLLAGVFASTELGVFSGYGFAKPDYGMLQQVGVQALGVVVTFVYTALLTWALLKLVGLFTPLRVSPDEESQGLDIALHEERGYDL
ncbi:ammonium transporter [Alloalcanivorax profundimaris]|uniref:Ammonium transporter n=1 Tax=Alloalcanivorax profundimaris TaxID=2735259 RepID=A0ABS0ASG8_9GAMM|nr:ammonium transporter [Alloalcanivorax profundimaris]MAO59613.1 ammonia channel protein [Alcanivorax sp.]MCQ6263954.1 ammonium transporter [Alcanivorax sp. MM125-6]UWN48348.1 Ammonia channel [Alcanivorax sp. ALC70]MAY09153.1 ammonia channel protein [Alcanivorax sp.]MBF1802503.1 ammonium transporter [Alloalcanivorax profundimaris]|tara:strand:+ start:4693 stop:5982 length:1290 start_codon:yes stop_codon:yes gene_type:complete